MKSVTAGDAPGTRPAGRVQPHSADDAVPKQCKVQHGPTDEVGGSVQRRAVRLVQYNGLLSGNVHNAPETLWGTTCSKSHLRPHVQLDVSRGKCATRVAYGGAASCAPSVKIRPKGRAVLKGGERGKRGFVTPIVTNVHRNALCFIAKTWARHKTTKTRIENCLAVGGGWRLAVGGPRGLSLKAVLDKKKKEKLGFLRTTLPKVLHITLRNFVLRTPSGHLFQYTPSIMWYTTSS